MVVVVMTTTTRDGGNGAGFDSLLLSVFVLAAIRGGGFRCGNGDRGERGAFSFVVVNRARDKDILRNRHSSGRGRGSVVIGAKRDGNGPNGLAVGMPSTLDILRSNRSYPPLTSAIKPNLGKVGVGTTLTIIGLTFNTEKTSLTSSRHTRHQTKQNKICKSLHIDNCKQRLVRTL
jgi:hypothetical protein